MATLIVDGEGGGQIGGHGSAYLDGYGNGFGYGHAKGGNGAGAGTHAAGNGNGGDGYGDGSGVGTGAGDGDTEGSRHQLSCTDVTDLQALVINSITRMLR